MTVVKSVQFRQNLKELLEKTYSGEEDNLFLDYYGKLFKITPVTNKAIKKSQSQKVVEHFQNLPPKKLTNPIFNESDPNQEKKNFRNLVYAKYEK